MNEPTDDLMRVGEPIPVYTQPAVSIRATWSATDGSRPEEVIIEWKDVVPARTVIALTLALIRNGAEVETRPGTLTSETGPDGPCINHCHAKGEAHDAADHYCVLPPGHEPVEPGGREHRCVCGGMFAAHGEIPDVPGRREQKRRER